MASLLAILILVGSPQFHVLTRHRKDATEPSNHYMTDRKLAIAWSLQRGPLLLPSIEMPFSLTSTLNK